MFQPVDKPHPYWFDICGFNIAILAGLFTLFFSRLLGRWRGAAVAALGIAFYTVLVGAGASVVRAALMGWLSLLTCRTGSSSKIPKTYGTLIATILLCNYSIRICYADALNQPKANLIHMRR